MASTDETTERSTSMRKESQPDTARKLDSIVASAKRTKNDTGKGVVVSLTLFVSEKLCKFTGPSGETVCITMPNDHAVGEFMAELVNELAEKASRQVA